MIFYRIHLTHEHGESLGYEWFTGRHLAERRYREHRKEYPEELTRDIERLTITPTKEGILTALNRFAGHPDNG